jgi:hypothetical protein
MQQLVLGWPIKIIILEVAFKTSLVVVAFVIKVECQSFGAFFEDHCKIVIKIMEPIKRVIN